MKEIEELLEAVTEAHSENRLSPQEVKEWLSEYSQLYEQDVAKFPEERGKSHWDLIAADFDSEKDALFLLAIFSSDSVTFVAGRGNSSAVRDLCENHRPKQPESVIAEVARRFGTVVTTALPLKEVKTWYTS